MTGNGKVKCIFDQFLDLLYTGIAEFKNLFCLSANHVIVLTISVGLFIKRKVFSKLMFFDQVTIQQEIKGVVNGRAAHPVIFVLHIYVKRLDVKMSLICIDFFQYGKSFGSLAKLLFLQVFCKYVPYFLKFFGCHDSPFLETYLSSNIERK